MKKIISIGIAVAMLLTGTVFAREMQQGNAVRDRVIQQKQLQEAAYQKDIQLFSQEEIAITNSVLPNGTMTTINKAAEDLGRLLEIRYFYEDGNDDQDDENEEERAVLLTHAFYENGELWMRGRVEADQIAPVERLTTRRLDVETFKGLKVGDEFEKIMELYGEPQYIHWNRLCQDDYEEVDRWLIYFCQEPYEKRTPKKERPEITKLLVGIKGLKVTRLGYSGMWRLGL